MPKKKSIPKSKCSNNKKSYRKKCSKAGTKENIDNNTSIVNLPTKTNQFLGLIKKVFGYE